MKTNFHTHCTYCDGKDPIETIVKKAIELHFDRLGFSSHAPLEGSHDFAIAESEIPAYLKEIEDSQQRHPDIVLYKALECDFIPGITKPFHYYKSAYNLDYIIGGVHLVHAPHQEELWFIDGSKQEIYDAGLSKFFNNDIKKAVTAFWEQTFEMIETEELDIIAHIDKIKMHNQYRFFTQKERWYEELTDHALSLIKRKDLIIEINTRGLYKGRCDEFYPADDILEKMGKMGIRSVISSDAHQAGELELLRKEAGEKLKLYHVEETQIDASCTDNNTLTKDKIDTTNGEYYNSARIRKKTNSKG